MRRATIATALSLTLYFAAGCDSSSDTRKSAEAQQQQALCYSSAEIPKGDLAIGVVDIDREGRVLFQDDSASSAFVWDGRRHDLRIPAGHDAIFTYGLNERGEVPGYALVEGTGRTDPFVWRDGEPTQLPLPAGGTNGLGSAINALGHIAGIFTAADGREHGVLWRGGVAIDLGPGRTSSTWSINDADEVALSADSRVVLWREGVRIDVGNLGGLFTGDVMINAIGDVAGRASTPSGQVHVFFWRDGALRDLGTFGGESSDIYRLNARGHIVGRSATASGEQHGFIWRGGGLIDLGPGSAFDINDADQVVAFDRTSLSLYTLVDGAKTILRTFSLPTDGPYGRINQTGVVVANECSCGSDDRWFLYRPTTCNEPPEEEPPE